VSTSRSATSALAEFAAINNGFNSVFKPNQLSIGLVAPLENHGADAVPTMLQHAERACLADQLGFKALWLRDVPFNVANFGDAGQLFDPFVYLGYLAAQTSDIALGVASIILPLRHPANIAKSAASVDVLANGRLILGVASGDRPEEYPAMNICFDERGLRFRESYTYIRQMANRQGVVNNFFGTTDGVMDLLPKPSGQKLPLLITGGSQQDPAWIAEQGDGWMIYPRDSAVQTNIIKRWDEQVTSLGLTAKPILQPLYVDLIDNETTPPTPIHLGFRSGISHLVSYLQKLQQAGVNHVALNLRFNQAPIEPTLKRLADDLLPEFS